MNRFYDMEEKYKKCDQLNTFLIMSLVVLFICATTIIIYTTKSTDYMEKRYLSLKGEDLREFAWIKINGHNLLEQFHDNDPIRNKTMYCEDLDNDGRFDLVTRRGECLTGFNKNATLKLVVGIYKNDSVRFNYAEIIK